MVVCCVPFCKSEADLLRSTYKEGNRITFHEFPINAVKRELWIEVINCEELRSKSHWNNNERPVVCSLHFHPKDFFPGTKIRCLRPDAVPSIFPESGNVQSILQSEESEHITEVACNKGIETGGNSIELQKYETYTDNSFNNSLPITLSSFNPGLQVLCFLPVAPNVVLPSQIASVEQSIGSGRMDTPITKVPSDKTCETGNASCPESSLQDSMNNISADRQNMVVMQKDNGSSVEECFTYSKLQKDLFHVKKPNQFWGVTPTDKFTVFAKWNGKYIPEKRIVVENNLNVKVFLGDLEINTMNLMEFTCAEDFSNLLERVDNIEYCEKEPVINHSS